MPDSTGFSNTELDLYSYQQSLEKILGNTCKHVPRPPVYKFGGY